MLAAVQAGGLGNGDGGMVGESEIAGGGHGDGGGRAGGRRDGGRDGRGGPGGGGGSADSDGSGAAWWQSGEGSA